MSIERLLALRDRFGPVPARRKCRLLERIDADRLTEAHALIAYHDLLLFLVAFPDTAQVRALAESALKRVAAVVRERVKSPREAARLDGSGLAYTSIVHSFTFDTTRWLCDRHCGAVEVEWDQGEPPSSVEEILPLLVASVETDGLLSHVTVDRWLALARGSSRTSVLPWLVRRFEQRTVDGPVRDRLFESLELFVRWRLTRPDASRTRQRFPARRIFHRDALDRKRPPADWIDRPLPPARPVAAAVANRLIDVGRAALGVRHRETDPMTHANPREVLLFHLERGLDVAIFGMLPDRRQPIESFFGYMIAMNRVPIGYGGGWVFADRCEIGINIFDTFRGGESTLAFAQLLRVYRGLFRARRFTVDPYQFGADNPEAIRSGAFWFYHGFGFRPVEPPLRALAEREHAKKTADRSHRSSRPVLRRLAEGRLALDLDASGDRETTPEVTEIGLAVTRVIGRRFGGDGDAAARHARRRLERILPTVDRDTWPPAERSAFDRLSILVSLLPGLERFTPDEKTALVALMRAKGGARERRYAERVRRHGRFLRAVRELVG